MAWSKQSWQCCHSCVVERSRKTLLAVIGCPLELPLCVTYRNISHIQSSLTCGGGDPLTYRNLPLMQSSLTIGGRDPLTYRNIPYKIVEEEQGILTVCSDRMFSLPLFQCQSISIFTILTSKLKMSVYI